MKILDILNQYTALELNKDLFYLEMPLDKSGLWIADAQIDNVRTGYRDYSIYYRGKTKESAIENIAYLQDTLDNLPQCTIDGEIFKLSLLYQWDYLEKDAEGYFVFANTLRLL